MRLTWQDFIDRERFLVGFESESEEEEESGEEGEGESEEEQNKPDDNDLEGLKSALQKERAQRKKDTRELKKLQREAEAASNKDKTAGEQATAQANKLKEANAKLATRLRDQAVEMAITKRATKYKFVDASDAVLHLSSKITVDQDEDDPSEIEIDEDELDELLKKLVKDKPHLIAQDKEEEEFQPSGSKFNGKKKSKTVADDDALREKFSALRRKVST